MLKVYIVDDEPLARDELKYLLARTKKVEIVGESDNIKDVMIEISKLNPNIIFLDIELAEENGLMLANQLATLYPNLAIVFATAFDEYAMQAFDLNAVDYILKPFDEKRIIKMLEKIKKLQALTHGESATPAYAKEEIVGKIAVLVDDRIILLNHADIVYLESYEGKCMVKALDREYKINDALISLEKKLNTGEFFRVHRGFIVNVAHIVEIVPWFNSTYNLIMADGSKVPVSRTYVKDLKQLVGI